jgi:hypothetical protein
MRQRIHLASEKVLSRVCRRIVFRLISRNYARYPATYNSHPPTTIYNLGQEYRMLFPALYPWFLYYSKNVQHGCKLVWLRDCDIEEAPRAVHKRRVHRPPS